MLNLIGDSEIRLALPRANEAAVQGPETPPPILGRRKENGLRFDSAEVLAQ